MRKSLFLALMGLAISGAVAAHVANFSFDISGASVNADQKTGLITVVDAEFPLRNSHALVSAPKATFSATEKGDPDSVKLVGETRIELNGVTTLASDATYYPELDQITASSVRLFSSQTVTWTCQSGTVYKNGVSTGGGSACMGSTEVSCTGTGGNRVNLRFNSSTCQ